MNEKARSHRGYIWTLPFNLLTNMLRGVASNTPHCIVLMESNITTYHILCQKGLSQLVGLDTVVFLETQKEHHGLCQQGTSLQITLEGLVSAGIAH